MAWQPILTKQNQTPDYPRLGQARCFSLQGRQEIRKALSIPTKLFLRRHGNE